MIVPGEPVVVRTVQPVLDGQVPLLKPHDGRAVEALLVVLAFSQCLGDPVRDVGRNLDAPDDVLEESPTVPPRGRTCFRTAHGSPVQW